MEILGTLDASISDTLMNVRVILSILHDNYFMFKINVLVL